MDDKNIILMRERIFEEKQREFRDFMTVFVLVVMLPLFAIAAVVSNL